MTHILPIHFTYAVPAWNDSLPTSQWLDFLQNRYTAKNATLIGVFETRIALAIKIIPFLAWNFSSQNPFQSILS